MCRCAHVKLWWGTSYNCDQAALPLARLCRDRLGLNDIIETRQQRIPQECAYVFAPVKSSHHTNREHSNDNHHT
jgi:hypothetical protein